MYKYVVKNNKIGTQLQDYLLNGQHSLGHLVCNLFPLGMRKQFVQKKSTLLIKKRRNWIFQQICQANSDLVHTAAAI